MTNGEKTARIDRRIDRRTLARMDKDIAAWEKQMAPRYRFSSWAIAAEERHENAMRAARGLPPGSPRLPSWALK